MIRCIIVEDEDLAQDVLRSHIQRIERLELVAVCNNAAEAQTALQSQDIDLMFLDIELPGVTGLKFLQSLSVAPLVIITTAYPQYAAESYEFDVVDYLLKPIPFERFARAANKVLDGRQFPLQQNTESADHIFIKSNSRFQRINFSEIIRVEAMRDYLQIFTEGSRLITLQTMNDMESILPKEKFIRVHRSHIVSVDHIKSVDASNIEIGDKSIPIGSSYRERVTAVINQKFPWG